jgi:hypothetical protein
LMYCANADQYLPEALEKDGYELSARFMPIAELGELSLLPSEQFYLQQALQP